MSKHLHIEDTLFYLQMRIRNLTDGLVLDLEPDLFLESYIQDLDLLQVCLNCIIHSIQENEKFIDWEEQVQNILDTEQGFMYLLEDIIQGKGTIGAAFIPIGEKLEMYKLNSKNRISQLEKILSQHPVEQDNGIVVSQQELHELLKD